MRLGQRVDGDRMASLLEDYDAVFMGVGLGPTSSLGIPGEEDMWEGLSFVFQTHQKALEDWDGGDSSGGPVARPGVRISIMGKPNTGKSARQRIHFQGCHQPDC